MGDLEEAARLFLTAKRINKKHLLADPFRRKISLELKKLLNEHPDLDVEKIKEMLELQSLPPYPKKKLLSVALGVFVPTTIAAYFVFSKVVKMPQKRRISTSISSGLLVGVISFFLSNI